MFARTRVFSWSHFPSSYKSSNDVMGWLTSRYYAKGKGSGDDCSKAFVDIPPDVDPVCPLACERRPMKKKGILHKIKLKVIEGGTNFGTPFRKLECKPKKEKSEEKKSERDEEVALALPEPEKKVIAMPTPRAGVQVSVLGADTALGQYVALLLKQCSCIKKLRLYEAKDSQGCTRDLCSVVQDLQHINTNCLVQAFSCAAYELEKCLQNSDIVLMLESGYLNSQMNFEQRFNYQAPIVKCYADAIAQECPKAFVIVCASPIDCMVPLIAMTMNETGWYDPRRLLGSLAVPEMRASTLAARALCLEPIYTRVPCVGGTEGEALVPLFSRAVEYFDFAQNNALMMTEAVRNATTSVARFDGTCPKSAELSEAHAIAGLVTKVAHALLCNDVPIVSGFVEADLGEVVSPARYMAKDMLLSHNGVLKRFDIPPRLKSYELTMLDRACSEIESKVEMVRKWFDDYAAMCQGRVSQKYFHKSDKNPRLDKCIEKLRT